MFLKYLMLSFGALPINFILSNERCKVVERVTKIENIKTDSTKILRPTRQKILRPTVFLSVLISQKEGE